MRGRVRLRRGSAVRLEEEQLDADSAPELGAAARSTARDRQRAAGAGQAAVAGHFYLWLRYAIFGVTAAEPGRARLVLAECRKLVPHATFTFAKLWLHAAHLEVRQLDLPAARKLLGNAIGRCPKQKIFREYIQLELQLGEISRCRELYGRYLQWARTRAQHGSTRELEMSLGEMDGARAIFNLAIGQPSLDMPETLWKAFIDFEIEMREFERMRTLPPAAQRDEPQGLDLVRQLREEADGGPTARRRSPRGGGALQAVGRQGGARPQAGRVEGDGGGDGGGGPRRGRERADAEAHQEEAATDGRPGRAEGWRSTTTTSSEEAAKTPSLKILEMAHKWKKQKTEHTEEFREEVDSGEEVDWRMTAGRRWSRGGQEHRWRWTRG